MSEMGPPPGATAGAAPPPATPAPSRKSTPWIIGGVVVVLVLVAAVVAVLLLDDDEAEAEVFLEPATEIGSDPFTEDVAPEAEPVVPLEGEQTPPSGAVQSQSGATPGLYGGTRDESTCNRRQLVEFLTSNRAKGQAWAGVLGIGYDEIETYVTSLTSVTLINDVRVTNHGYADGQATVIQSVLQSGTAVLVDTYGVPRVRCSCGNPLKPPTPVGKPVYKGPKWQWWSPGGITVISQSTTIINIFVLTDIATGEKFSRPAGSDGDEDADAPGEEPEPTTTTTAPDETTTAPAPPPTEAPTTTTTTEAPTTTTEPEPTYTESDIIDLYFQVRDGACAGAQYPFEPHESETQRAADNGDGTWRLSVTGTLASGARQPFLWDVNPSTGKFTPQNANAREAARVCAAWG